MVDLTLIQTKGIIIVVVFLSGIIPSIIPLLVWRNKTVDTHSLRDRILGLANSFAAGDSVKKSSINLKN